MFTSRSTSGSVPAQRHPVGRRDRGTLIAALALVGVAAIAWAALLLPAFGSDATMSGMGVEPETMGEDAMEMPGATEVIAPAAFAVPLGAATFLASWLVMMTAMMLPSAAPMVLLYRAMATGSATRRARHTAVFVSGYLVAWSLFGAVVYLVQQGLVLLRVVSPGLDAAWPLAVALVLASAGLYQFSPLKDRCLRQCRSPFSFLMLRWEPGIGAGFRLGVRHGLYCVGCCWGLMVVLVAAGAMGLPWVTLIALVVFGEKLLPRSPARLVGLLLLGLAAAVAIRPDLSALLAG
jgi:predicted metal-binding membrane protein